MEAPPVIQTQKTGSGFFLFAIVLGLNLLVVLLSLPLYRIPSGTSIRPMSWAYYCGLISLAAFCLVPVSLAYMIRRRRFLLWPICALPLGLAPWLISSFMLHHAAHIHNLFLAP